MAFVVIAGECSPSLCDVTGWLSGLDCYLSRSLCTHHGWSSVIHWLFVVVPRLSSLVVHRCPSLVVVHRWSLSIVGRCPSLSSSHRGGPSLSSSGRRRPSWSHCGGGPGSWSRRGCWVMSWLLGRVVVVLFASWWSVVLLSMEGKLPRLGASAALY